MCGIVGVIGSHHVNQKIFDALTMLQHRGQNAAGILTCDGLHISLRKAQGLVVEAIRNRHMQSLTGNIGIGHVRYPTSGKNTIIEAQPFYVNSPYGIALAHNGNLVNTEDIIKDLIEKEYRHINTTSDSELLLNVLAAEMQNRKVSIKNFITNIFFDAIKRLYHRCVGGYAVVGVIAGIGLFGFRDPYGIRPLIMGKKIINGKIEYMIASESVALECDNYEIIGDIGAGEAVFIDFRGKVFRQQCAPLLPLTPCIFEYVYLARPDSVIDGASVYRTRLVMGKLIANKILQQLSKSKNDIDVVIPVPDSGRHAALSIAKSLQVPYREGFVKNRYVGRTFIMSNQEERANSIRKKLNIITHEFIRKHVLLVDDSIVRGNTSKLIVQIARQAGARKVSIVSTAPVVKYPNVYGIDMPTYEELIGHNRSIQEIANLIDVDYLFYQTLEDLIAAIKSQSPKLNQFETSIFDGKYITGNIDKNYLLKVYDQRESQKKITSRYQYINLHNQE